MVESIESARAGCQAWLSSQDSPEAVIAAHEAGAARDDEAARRWVHRILTAQESTGSWDGDLLTTAIALLTIQELRQASGLQERDPGISRALDWLQSRRGEPGSWTDGCDPDRHERGFCHHFAGGFFSPGPPEPRFEEVRLPSGARVAGDAEVRFVVSATALRCVLSWGLAGPDARLHLEVLRRLVDAWEQGPPLGLSTGALLAAVHGLAASDADVDGAAAARGLRLIAGRQRGDGSWVETDAFHALDVIGATAAAGVAPERARRALWHGARLLIASQQPDGSWGRDHGARRALIAWRSFHQVGPTRP